MSRLVVISNRVAVPRANRPAPGGLAVGLNEALSKDGGIWFGWDGKVVERKREECARLQHGNIEYITQPLTRQEYELYYKGYANRVLWPLCHERMNLIEYQDAYYNGYRRVNAQFAARLAKFIQPDDVIWVHDYHLIPLAYELKQLGINNRIGFFLHIPFPAYDLFRILPHYHEVLRLFCMYDLVGFQTELDLDAFRDCIWREYDNIEIRADSLQVDGRRVGIGHFPIGIDLENIRQQAAKGRKSSQVKRLRESLSDRDLIIGVDRLDYSKGLVQRFRAFERFLSNYPGQRASVVLMQIAQPSRSDVPEYQQIRDEVDFLAGKINARYSQYDRVPLRHLNRGFARPSVLGFLSYSQVGLITPLRDGMNLVAKEFVAAQQEEDPGVLILSRLAGAAPELCDGAVMVTPYNIDGVAEAIAKALAMPLAERRERWHLMMKVLANNTIDDWTRRFLDAL